MQQLFVMRCFNILFILVCTYAFSFQNVFYICAQKHINVLQKPGELKL